MTTDVILVLNAGSSSVKFRLFELSDNLPLYAQGRVIGIGTQPRFFADKENVVILPEKTDQSSALKTILHWINTTHPHLHIKVVGHRIVHGGHQLTTPVYLSDQNLNILEALIPLAPLHQPHSLFAVKYLADLYPDLVQIGCFDTAFHAGHDPVFCHYALPKYLREQGIRRYGFHGLSYEWVMHCLQTNYPEQFKGRVVAAHLGNGASLCAIKAGRSIDTTMGMTALDGLPMGTRCGSIDPGAILYMLQTLKMDAKTIEHVLSYEAGLKGLSGISNDVEELLADDNEEAALAIRFFCMMTAQHIARMGVALGGIDTLVFTGGIGEHAGAIRQLILGHLQWLGPPETLILAANEERMIARHCIDLYTSNA